MWVWGQGQGRAGQGRRCRLHAALISCAPAVLERCRATLLATADVLYPALQAGCVHDNHGQYWLWQQSHLQINRRALA